MRAVCCALRALGRVGGDWARSYLRRAARDPDPAINVLAQVFRDDAEAEVRLGALRALGRVGGDWARSYLRRAARDPDPAISLAAEEALAASSPEN